MLLRRCLRPGACDRANTLARDRLLWILTTLSIVLYAVAPVHADTAPTAGVADDGILTLGRVSGSPRKHYPAFESLAMYLAPKLSDYGVTGFEVVLTPDNEQMVEALREGTIDVVSETAFSALAFEMQGVAEPFLRQWKGGIASYTALFITRMDSGINSLDDLRGRIVAFEDPGSTSGFFIPLVTVVRSGLSAVPDDGTTRASAVRYVFAGNEENVFAWVARERADAGAISSRDWKDPKRAPPGLKQQLRAFYESPPIIRSLLLVRTGLAPDLRLALAEILVNMHDDPEGQVVLQAFFKTARFDALEGEALNDLAFARGLFAEFHHTLTARPQ